MIFAGEEKELSLKFHSDSFELEDGISSEEYVNKINGIIYNKFQISKLILENDFYRKLWNSMNWEI